MEFFTTIHQSSKSKARTGVLNVNGREVKTPAFVPVATRGTLKGVPPQAIDEIGIQIAFVNTYHLVTHPGAEIIEKAGGIKNFAKLSCALMSDSGGFQVFSLANNKRRVKFRSEEDAPVLKINEDGVLFRSIADGKEILFTPEKSIEYQKQIGADIIMAFDECTYYPATYEYTKKSMERTHAWLTRCVQEFNRNKGNQFLYGIIQGGAFEDLRKESAKFVTEQNTDGIAIGGVSVGESKENIYKEIEWASKDLPADKPVHLLGVGQIDDIVSLVKFGIDTFDCVEPTRHAREGKLLRFGEYDFEKILKNNLKNIELWRDITKKEYKDDLSEPVKNCACYVCQNFTKAYLHHLFTQKEISAHYFATYHNLYAMEQLFVKIREAITNDAI